jgi:uncharacterized circularly permuted ATP-grasp superfamily protein
LGGEAPPGARPPPEEQYAFGIREGDKTHPTDWFPRVVPAADWERLERGVAQRMRAVNEFLRRLEAGKEEVVPEEIIETSISTTPPSRTASGRCRCGRWPSTSWRSRAIGAARPGAGKYRVLEENAKMPVGLAAMSRRRR